MRRIFIILTSLSVFGWSGCINVFKVSDLRPKNLDIISNPIKAKQLMHKMGVAHRIHLWDSIETYKVTFEDEFYGIFGKLSHPFKEQKVQFSLSYIPKTFNGQVKILTGKEQGTLWGLQAGKTYQKDTDDQIILKKNKDMAFWIPTYQYFIEFPNRIQEATAFEYIGTKVINGIASQGVLASWNTVEPQKKLDQYLIWMDASTHQIVKIEYTIRDANRFVLGAAFFNNYTNYNGLLLPAEMPVETNLVKKGLLHTMRILDFKKDVVGRAALLPLK